MYGYYDKVTHMKTTVELPDALLAEAKRAAAEDGTTLRELVERGLRRVLHQRAQGGRFRLRDASVDGHGVQEEFRDAGWERLRSAAYGDRGG